MCPKATVEGEGIISLKGDIYVSDQHDDPYKIYTKHPADHYRLKDLIHETQKTFSVVEDSAGKVLNNVGMEIHWAELNQGPHKATIVVDSNIA